LDNNIVAAFVSHGLRNLEISTLHLFIMAQISGYGLGGCWTHIGSAQSVVACAFIQRDVDAKYTSVQWNREMTPIILEILAVIALTIYIESAFLRSFTCFWNDSKRMLPSVELSGSSFLGFSEQLPGLPSTDCSFC